MDSREGAAMRQHLRILVIGLLGSLLAACAGAIPQARPPVATVPPTSGTVSRPVIQPIPTTPPVPATASMMSVASGPAVAGLGVGPNDAGAALLSFRESCPVLLRREDASGLTRPSDWRAACDAASGYSSANAVQFFDRFFETARVGDGAAFATGYFEPEIRGSRTRRPGYDAAVYGMPPELVRAWPADFPETERTGRPPLGRYAADGSFVQFYERSEIEAGALANRGLEIAWAADPIELFFLQIQGSGRLISPEGDVTRIGYAGQNGREYVGIGKVMADRGLIGGTTGYATSMQGIVAWLNDHPAERDEILNLNKSWVFFRVLEGDGPLGSIGIPVRGESSVAVDPRYVPYGAPVWLGVDRPEANGLWIAQDTGGAIKGANRFDTFWGAGEQARATAGGMAGRGRALVFLPRAAADRLRR